MAGTAITEWIRINEAEPLHPGDTLRMEFKSIGGVWFKAVQIAIIESRLRSKPNFRLVSSSYERDRIVLDVKIIEPPQSRPQVAGIITAAVIVAVVVGVVAPVVWYLSLTGLYKKAKPAVIAGSIVGVLAAVAAVLALLKGLK